MKARARAAWLLALWWPGGGSALEPEQLAVIVNRLDPQSVAVGDYYLQARGIPRANRIEVAFTETGADLVPERFTQLRAQILAATPASVQAYAVAWTTPYRVGCMSITSALAAGFDTAYCATGCRATAPNPLYDSATRTPYTDSGWRPSMLLAGRSIDNVRQLIERGRRADYQGLPGAAYLLLTSDRSRSSRALDFATVQRQVGTRLPVNILQADAIRDRYDVMFYFTGMKQVEGLETLGFLPGAIADHLTSLGGDLDGASQMSALRWLEAGATASYGTVTEPCNFPQKFPRPSVVMRRYLDGESVLEAYWKSVAWPGQGLFIGEPLARPFARRGASP